ncbi:hypothetical protein V3G39_09225 [Dermatophilaceae bacterium Sec6.4]
MTSFPGVSGPPPSTSASLVIPTVLVSARGTGTAGALPFTERGAVELGVAVLGVAVGLVVVGLVVVGLGFADPGTLADGRFELPEGVAVVGVTEFARPEEDASCVVAPGEAIAGSPVDAP